MFKPIMAATKRRALAGLRGHGFGLGGLTPVPSLDGDGCAHNEGERDRWLLFSYGARTAAV
jgi:hypothetical protein